MGREKQICKLSNKLSLIGMALSLIGVPLGMYLNWFYPIFKWSPIIMLICIILVVNWGNLLKFNFPSLRPILKFIIAFQFLMILYGLLDIKGAMTTQYLSFHLFIICLCIGYCSQGRNLNLSNLPKIVFYMSMILTLLGAILCSQGLVVGDDVWQAKQYTDDYALEAFTVSAGALTNYFAAISMQKGKISKILSILFIIMDIYILFACTKRTPIFVCLVGTFVYFYKTNMFSYRNLSKLMKLVPICFICFIYAYVSFSNFADTVDSFVANFYNGVLVLFGDTHASDESGSAVARVEAREFMYNYINLKFSFINYLFGGGYMVKWLDAPILEAYLDMGIGGFLSYFFLIVLLPIKYIFKSVRNIKQNSTWIFALLMTLYPMLSMLNSGNPYQYLKYTNICLLVFVVGQYKNITYENNI